MRNRSIATPMAAVAVVGGCAVALSGCHEVLRATFGRPDPPVHNPPPAGRAAPVAHAAASAGRAFNGKASGKLASRIQLKHGFVKSTMGPGRFIGTFTGTLPGAAQPGDELLAPFTRSDWHAVFKAVLDRRNKKITMSGLILADYVNSTSGTAVAGRACLRMGYKNARKGKRFVRNRGRSTVTVLGGEGDAATLVGSAVVKVRQTTGDNFRMSGRAKVRRGASRGLNAACTKLERKFKLAPLS
jgi:hypothetical protein